MNAIDATALLDAADAELVEWANALLDNLDLSDFITSADTSIAA